ncbi:MAG TPA: aminoglycoside phosphotransferase family protein [Thermoanaerobaculia bacterium]|nr:aminoglycoside phosphotransferase family protein [Thermoanaerobaculia bacterium]
MSADGALLARLDWRFLLPPAADDRIGHLLLLGGPPGLADAAREAGIAERVSTEVPSAAAADVVALLRGTPTPLEAAARALRPGGAAYVESDERRRLWDPAAPLRRGLARLRRCGLTTTGTWALWPEPERWEVCLPLAAPAAVRWFARTLYPTRTARELAVQTGLRLLPGRSAALLLTRFFAWTAAAAPAASRPALLADPGLPPELRRGDLEPALVSHGRERVLALPFPRRGTRPAAVLKVPRLAAFNGKTEAEQAVLVRMKQALSAETARAVPGPRGVVRHRGLAVGIEEYLSGRPLLLTGSRWRRPLGDQLADLRQAASWIAGMHRETEQGRSPWGPREAQTWIEEPCAAFERRFGTGENEARLFGAARERAQGLRGLPFPVVLRHRDFTPWNLLSDAGRLRVLDWEGLEPGPPLCDLLHFLTHWAELARGAPAPAARHAVFHETLIAPRAGDPVAEAADAALAGYCAELRLERAFVPLLLVHTWVEISLRSAQRGPDAAYVGVLAAHAGDLFGRPGDARRAA